MIKRFYSIDDNLELTWVDLAVETKDVDHSRKYSVVASEDGSKIDNFFGRWLFSDQNVAGVWHASPSTLINQLEERIEDIKEIYNKHF